MLPWRSGWKIRGTYDGGGVSGPAGRGGPGGAEGGHRPGDAGPVVNPTHVGMDRTMEKSKWSEHCKPHARGDGPVIEAQAEADANVNPTHVGMDRVGEAADGCGGA